MYKNKYLKYKNKYLELKNQFGSGTSLIYERPPPFKKEETVTLYFGDGVIKNITGEDSNLTYHIIMNNGEYEVCADKTNDYFEMRHPIEFGNFDEANHENDLIRLENFKIKLQDIYLEKTREIFVKEYKNFKENELNLEREKFFLSRVKDEGADQFDILNINSRINYLELKNKISLLTLDIIEKNGVDEEGIPILTWTYNGLNFHNNELFSNHNIFKNIPIDELLKKEELIIGINNKKIQRRESIETIKLEIDNEFNIRYQHEIEWYENEEKNYAKHRDFNEELKKINVYKPGSNVLINGEVIIRYHNLQRKTAKITKIFNNNILLNFAKSKQPKNSFIEVNNDDQKFFEIEIDGEKYICHAINDYKINDEFTINDELIFKIETVKNTEGIFTLLRHTDRFLYCYDILVDCNKIISVFSKDQITPTTAPALAPTTAPALAPPSHTHITQIFTIPNSGQVITTTGNRYSSQCMWISIRDYLNYTRFEERTNYTVDEIRNIASNNGEFTINTEREDVNLELSEDEQAKLGVPGSKFDEENTIQRAIKRVADKFELFITLYSLKGNGPYYDSPQKLAGDGNSNHVYILSTGGHFELITKINDIQLLDYDMVKERQKKYTIGRLGVNLNAFDDEKLIINPESQKDLSAKYKENDIVILTPGDVTIIDNKKDHTKTKRLVRIISADKNKHTYLVNRIDTISIDTIIVYFNVPEDRLESPKFKIDNSAILKPCIIKLENGQVYKINIDANVTIINIKTDDNGNVLYNARAENRLVIIDIKETDLQKFKIGDIVTLKPCNIKLNDGKLGKTDIDANVTIINIRTDDNGNVLYNARAENGLEIIDIDELNFI